MINNNKYEYYIFDCDGVILNSNTIKNQAFRETLKDEKSSLIEEFIKYHQKNGGVSRYEKFLFFYQKMKQSKQYKKDTKIALSKFSTLVQKELIKSQYVPGAIDYIQKLYNLNKKLYVVSGGDQNELNVVFSAKKIDYFFKKILGSPTTKKINTRTVKNENDDKNNGIFFGDSKLDFLCAQEFEMDFVYVTKYSEWEKFYKYENEFLLSVDDFGELL